MADNTGFGELKFRVHEGTYDLIAKDLNDIVDNINKTPFKVKFSFDKNDLKSLQKSLIDIDGIQKKQEKQRITTLQDSLKKMQDLLKGSTTDSASWLKGADRTNKDIDNFLAKINELRTAFRDALGGKELDDINPYEIKDFTKLEGLLSQVKLLSAEVDRLKDKAKVAAQENKISTTSSTQGITSYAKAIKDAEKELEALNSTNSKWINAVPRDSSEYKAYIDAVEELREKQKALFDAGVTKDSKGPFTPEQIQKAEEMAQAYDKVRNAKNRLKTSSGLEKDVGKATLTYDKLINKLTTYYEKFKGTIGKSPEAMAKYQQVLNSLQTRAFGQETGKAAQAVQEFMIEMQQTGKTVETFGQTLKRVFSDKLFYGAMTTLAAYARRLIVQIYENVKNIDAAMTELRKVTSETEDVYDSFLNNATGRAKSLGTTLSDIVSSTADFARLGYNIEDASTLADVATIYKNVGDGIDDINVASESIISTMQAFGIEVQDAMSIVDKFNEVGNNFAIGSSGIGEALVRSASALHAAGNTLDESIALITTANTIVQNPDSVGTAMKTLSMYLRAAKTEAEAAGESTEGMANSVSELREEILSLTGNKVDIQVDEDTFKSTYQIIKELSEVWGDLTDVSKANILEMIGGKRNANVTSALLENFDIAEDVLATAGHSAGSALAENEKYLDSINGKLSQLSASFQSFSTHALDSAWLGFGIDILTGLVDIADALAKVNTLLPLTISLFATFKTVGKPKHEGFHKCAHVSSGGDTERACIISFYRITKEHTPQRVLPRELNFSR